MSNGAMSLAADLVEAGALDVAAACESVGVDPTAAIAGVLAQLKTERARPNQEDT